MKCQTLEITEAMCQKSDEDIKKAALDLLNKDIGSRVCILVMAKMVIYESDENDDLYWEIINTEVFDRQTVFDKHNDKYISIVFGLGDEYTLGPLTIHMRRKSKESETFDVIGVYGMSLIRSNSKKTNVLRWHDVTDFSEEHPIFEKIRIFNTSTFWCRNRNEFLTLR